MKKKLLWEKRLLKEGYSLIIGIDEAGRGPLAGPVVSGAFLFPRHLEKQNDAVIFKSKITDSKKLSFLQREKAYLEIEKKALFSTGIKNHKYIDKHNIYNATLRSMEDAVTELVEKYCTIHKKSKKEIKDSICLLIDGNMKPNLPYKMFQIIKGDSKSFVIAAASIVAKVTRDRLMLKYDKKYPKYSFKRHKGYGTKQHIDMIKKYGPSPIHRKSFNPIKNFTQFA